MLEYKYEDGLITDRLYTRFLVPEDAIAWTNFFEDKEAMEFFPVSQSLNPPAERAKQWVDRQLLRYEEKRYGLQAILKKDTHELIGQCGLITQEVDGGQVLEVGYHLLRNYWGKGYGTEISSMFFDYGFRNKQADSIVSIIDIRNIRSQRVADKNGLKRGKQTRWNELDVFIYSKKSPLS